MWVKWSLAYNLDLRTNAVNDMFWYGITIFYNKLHQSLQHKYNKYSKHVHKFKHRNECREPMHLINSITICNYKPFLITEELDN